MAQNDTQSAPITSDNESEGGLSVTAAAERMAELSDEVLGITGSPSAKKPSKARPPVEEDDEETEEPDRPKLDDEDDDEPEDEDEDDEDQEDPDVESEAEEDDEDSESPELHTVKVDGVDEKVPYKELLAGYSRTAVFTKKSQALAEEKRAHDAALTSANDEIRALREHYTAQLGALEEVLEQPEPNWEQIRKETPDEFAAIHAAWQVHKSRIERITAERAAEAAKITAQQAKSYNDHVTAERAKLVAAVPEWGDQTEKGAKLRSAVREFGLKNGFTQQELEGVADHRALALLHKAYLHDLSQAEKSKTREKGKKKIESAPILKPGAKQGSKTARRTRHEAAVSRLKRTGDVRDAAKAFEAFVD